MKILRVMLAAVLFVACVFVATANMHQVALFLPDVPIQGWPLAGEFRAPLFVVILTALVVGVIVTGLATLFEQIRLRSTARRARRERERAMTALEPAETARDAALQEQAKLREELRVAHGTLEQARQERDEAMRSAESLRLEREEARAALAQLRAEIASAAPAVPAATPAAVLAASDDDA